VSSTEVAPFDAQPILVMAFNRPDHLRVLLRRLQEIKPTTVYFAVDGARVDCPDEDERVRECRAMIEDIDWIPNKQMLFQESNLGCGLGVSTAISWFFSNEAEGIILEDDIIPDPSFFPYCAELLNRHATDQRVFAISGCNFVPPAFQSHPDLPYRFSQVPHIWGWATWRDRWAKHNLDIAGWQRQLSPSKLWRRSGKSVSGALYWASTFELLARKEVDTWDGQLVFASMLHAQWTATSNVNLIENIGFDALATHTIEDREELPAVQAINLPLRTVPVELDERADAWTRAHHFRVTPHGLAQQASRYLRRKIRRAS
jgi:hypothetical protein